MSESHRLAPKLNEAEIERIWNNTKRWEIANSEVAVLFDLAEGLKKSGYKPSWQIRDEQRDASFLLLDKNSVKQALDIICYYQSFILRFNGEEYRDGKLGLHPSSVLSSRDLRSNPELLVLLIGEVEPSFYQKRNIKTDFENKEIIVEHYFHYIDEKETGMKKFKKRDFSKSDAFDSAVDFASAVSSLSSPEERNKHSGDMSLVYFDWERNIGGKLGLEFENPYLTVDGKPLYEIGAINQNLMKKREVQKRFGLVRSSMAVQQIGETILAYEKNISSEKGAYFPIFTMRH